MSEHIRVVQFEATPEPCSEAAELATGAYVNVYVRAATDQLAVERARNEVEAGGWQVTTMTGVASVSAESFEPGSDGLAHYEQCRTDGIVVALHTWRHEH
jgi:hypothetical protein